MLPLRSDSTCDKQRGIVFMVAPVGCWCSALLCLAAPVWSDEPQRPTPEFNRWQEDWSVLADPGVPREPLDDLKYIPLSPEDPHSYLSLGANLRERFESNNSVGFGTGNQADSYIISRLEVHSDLRIAEQLQLFMQLQSDYALGKEIHTPVDQDRLDLEQAFIAITEPLAGGELKMRVGRQQFSFDLQRFISARDGPNVRQSYDAAWLDYEISTWRFITFYSHPVQDRDLAPFDDYSSPRLRYGGFRIEYRLTPTASISAYLSRFNQDDARFLTVTGDEQRDIADLRFAGSYQSLDWDVESMSQSGRIGGKDIQAWALGSLAGWTWDSQFWKPRVGLQVDAASGNRNPVGSTLNTFNPLFPNGYYVTLAGYTGYVNFIHVKPSLTVHPLPSMKLMLAWAAQWRETTQDAIYTQPNIPVPNTAGRGGSFTGRYEQLRWDWAPTSHIPLAVEMVHFDIGDALRMTGGHDGNYAGLEGRYAW
jgi:hypothetical protein